MTSRIKPPRSPEWRLANPATGDEDPPREPFDERRMKMRRRILVMTAIVVAIWIFIAFDPFFQGPIVVAVVGFGATLAIAAAAIVLGGIGFAIFAGFDRVAARIRKLGAWPDEPLADDDRTIRSDPPPDPAENNRFKI